MGKSLIQLNKVKHKHKHNQIILLLLSSIPSSQDEEKERETIETNTNFKTPTPTYEERLTSIDVLNLPQDLGKRRRVSQFHLSDRDIVRREYCSRDLCQPYKHEFKLTKFWDKKL